MEAGNFSGVLLSNCGSNHNWEQSLLNGFSVGSQARELFFGCLAVVSVHRLRVQGELHEGHTALGGVLGGPIKISVWAGFCKNWKCCWYILLWKFNSLIRNNQVASSLKCRHSCSVAEQGKFCFAFLCLPNCSTLCFTKSQVLFIIFGILGNY